MLLKWSKGAKKGRRRERKTIHSDEKFEKIQGLTLIGKE